MTVRRPSTLPHRTGGPRVVIAFPVHASSACSLVALIVAACTGSGEVRPRSRRRSEPTVDPSASPEPPLEPSALTVGLGYIPSVQFAPFYLAQQAGYYEEAGLDVTFQNKIDPDLVALVGAGNIDVGISDGTSVIPAVSQAIPIQYIATIYGQFPNVVFAKTSSGITSAADLEGRKIGTPGRYGSGWIMLQALLGSADLTTEDVEIVEYPDFTQRIAVSEGAVDAATGFANNEPVQLELDGDPATVLRIDDITPLPGPGLIAGTATLETKQRRDRRLRRRDACGRWRRSRPTRAWASRRPSWRSRSSRRLAKRRPPCWPRRSTRGPVPSRRRPAWAPSTRAGWTESIAFLTELGLVPNPVTVDDLVRTDLLPGGN